MIRGRKRPVGTWWVNLLYRGKKNEREERVEQVSPVSADGRGGERTQERR